MAGKKKFSPANLDTEMLERRARGSFNMYVGWKWQIAQCDDEKKRAKMEEARQFCLLDYERCMVILEERNFETNRDTELDQSAQEIIGQLEMDALILARDPNIEVMRCTRLDGSTYLTTRRKARA